MAQQCARSCSTGHPAPPVAWCSRDRHARHSLQVRSAVGPLRLLPSDRRLHIQDRANESCPTVRSRNRHRAFRVLMLTVHQRDDASRPRPWIRLGRHWRDTPTVDGSQMSIGHALTNVSLRQSRLARTLLRSLGFEFPPTPPDDDSTQRSGSRAARGQQCRRVSQASCAASSPVATHPAAGTDPAHAWAGCRAPWGTVADSDACDRRAAAAAFASMG